MHKVVHIGGGQALSAEFEKVLSEAHELAWIARYILAALDIKGKIFSWADHHPRTSKAGVDLFGLSAASLLLMYLATSAWSGV